MTTLYEYLEKKIGRISFTQLPEKANNFPGIADIWMIRTDLIAETIKLFAAASLLFDAWQKGLLEGVTTIVVCSSGNFAIAMASILKDFGNFKLIAIVPESIDPEKEDRLRHRGVRIKKVSEGAFALADAYAKEPDCVHLHQYKNVAMAEGAKIYLAPQVLKLKPKIIAVPLGTGGTAMAYRGAGPATILGVNLIQGEKISGMRDPKRQKEVELPWLENIHYLESVSRRASVMRSRELQDADIMVKTSSGAALRGFDQWVKKQLDSGQISRFFNQQGRLVAAISCADSVFARV